MAIRVGLFGFGKTGKIVAGEIIQDAKCTLEWVVRGSRANAGEFASDLLGFKKDEGRIFAAEDVDPRTFFADNPVDVIIDFAGPLAVKAYAAMERCSAKIVSAVSKYTPEDLALLNDLGRRTAVLYSPNITVGINFLIVVSKILQSIAPHADIEVVEEHFRNKKDVSGTALKIADELGLDRQQHVNSIRVGGIVGRHEVIFGMPNQTIRLVHESINRAAFGQGAIFAAKWLVGQKPGLYTMDGVIRQRFASHLLAAEPSPSARAAISDSEAEAFTPKTRSDVDNIWFV